MLHHNHLLTWLILLDVSPSPPYFFHVPRSLWHWKINCKRGYSGDFSCGGSDNKMWLIIHYYRVVEFLLWSFSYLNPLTHRRSMKLCTKVHNAPAVEVMTHELFWNWYNYPTSSINKLWLHCIMDCNFKGAWKCFLCENRLITNKCS